MRKCPEALYLASHRIAGPPSTKLFSQCRDARRAKALLFFSEPLQILNIRVIPFPVEDFKYPIMNLPIDNHLLFAIPKKGRLYEICLDLLSTIGLKYNRPARLDVAVVNDMDIALVFLPGAEFLASLLTFSCRHSKIYSRRSCRPWYYWPRHSQGNSLTLNLQYIVLSHHIPSPLWQLGERGWVWWSHEIGFWKMSSLPSRPSGFLDIENSTPFF